MPGDDHAEVAKTVADNATQNTVSGYNPLATLSKGLTMPWQDYIEQNPDVMLGKPVIKGTRITVQHVVERLGNGWSIEEIVQAHPRLTKAHVLAALQFAAKALATDEQVFLRETA